MKTNDAPLTLTYRQLQELVKQAQVGIVTTKVKLNSSFKVLAKQYHVLKGVEVTKAPTKAATKQAAKAVVDGRPSYCELQATLKGYGSACTVRRNAKYEILFAELQRLQSSQEPSIYESVS